MSSSYGEEISSVTSPLVCHTKVMWNMHEALFPNVSGSWVASSCTAQKSLHWLELLIQHWIHTLVIASFGASSWSKEIMLLFIGKNFVVFPLLMAVTLSWALTYCCVARSPDDFMCSHRNTNIHTHTQWCTVAASPC